MLYLHNFLNNILKNKNLFWSVLVIILIGLMITHPKEVFDGATKGLQTLSIVIPSLLPFFIISELLMSFGIVRLMGILLEPVMRPIFNLPGSSSFVLAVGYTSGYPIGSVLTAKLRKEKLCTRLEAERLMSFTNNASPLFMLVAVSVGMFNNPKLGYLIAGTHYLSNLTLGFLLRFYGRKDPEANYYRPTTNNSPVLTNAYREFILINQNEERSIGNILGDAIKSSLGTMFNICGFIILFAVLIKLLNSLGIIAIISSILGIFLSPLGFPESVTSAISSGIFEITIGSKLVSEAQAPFIYQVVAISIILAWSGLSVHAQIASIISDTDIRLKLFFLSRIFHAFLSSIYIFILGGMFNSYFLAPLPVFNNLNNNNYGLLAWQNIKICLLAFLAILTFLLLLSFLTNILKNLKIIIIRFKKI